MRRCFVGVDGSWGSFVLEVEVEVALASREECCDCDWDEEESGANGTDEVEGRGSPRPMRSLRTLNTHDRGRVRMGEKKSRVSQSS